MNKGRGEFAGADGGHGSIPAVVLMPPWGTLPRTVGPGFGNTGSIGVLGRAAPVGPGGVKVALEKRGQRERVREGMRRAVRGRLLTEHARILVYVPF